MKPLLTEQQVEALFDWMNAHSEEFGLARGRAIRTKYRIDIVESKLVLDAPEATDARRKAWARTQEEYEQACNDHADAEAAWENMKEISKKFGLMSEAWRTISANDRGIMRAVR